MSTDHHSTVDKKYNKLYLLTSIGGSQAFFEHSSDMKTDNGTMRPHTMPNSARRDFARPIKELARRQSADLGKVNKIHNRKEIKKVKSANLN